MIHLSSLDFWADWADVTLWGKPKVSQKLLLLPAVALRPLIDASAIMGSSVAARPVSCKEQHAGGGGRRHVSTEVSSVLLCLKARRSLVQIPEGGLHTVQFVCSRGSPPLPIKKVMRVRLILCLCPCSSPGVVGTQSPQFL